MDTSGWLFSTVATPLGTCTVAGPPNAWGLCVLGDASAWITRLGLVSGRRDDLVSEISAYFAGELRDFTIPVDWSLAGPFQRRVLEALVAIPYGETTSYGALAATVGQPRAARAVGGAVGRNPMCVVVPCHRVLGATGGLHGFAYGLDAKRHLLALEGIPAARAPRTPALFS